MSSIQRSAFNKFQTIYGWFTNPEQFFEDVFNEVPYPYQADVLTYVARFFRIEKRILLLAASGTGKTKLLAAIGLFFAVVLSQILRRPMEVIILSGSQLQARKVYDYIRTAINRHPIISDMKTHFRMSDTEFSDGSKIKALPNSLTATQGQHGDIVIVDEASLVGDFLLMDCYRIIGASDGMILLSGTPTIYDSKFVRDFEDLMEKTRKGEKIDWKIFTWSAKDCPKLKDMYEEMRTTLTEDMFQIFWEGVPYALTGTLIPRDSLVEATRGVKPFKWNKNLKTIFGMDWGYRDPTTCVIIQTDGEKYYVLEAWSWRETDFDIILDFVKLKAEEYGVYRIFTDSENKGENLRLRKKGLPVIEIAFNKEKVLMQSRLRDLFIKNSIFIPDVENMGLNKMQDLIQQLRVYTWTKKTGEDLVDGLMLACRETSKSKQEIYISHGKPKRRKKLLTLPQR